MLPAVRTNEEWEAVVWNEEIVRPAAEDIAGRLGLAGAGLRRYPEGSRPVYAAGGRRDSRLLGRMLAGYGRGFDPRELLAYTLLHRHSNLTECLREFPEPPAPTLDSLALTWFGTA